MAEKILIVEDNARNMRLFSMILKAAGYIPLEATDGTEALVKAVQEHPDLILMDVQLPGLSGLEVTARLRQMPGFERVPIIAISAYAMKGDQERIIEAGCDTYLSKPINTRELSAVVATVMSEKRQKYPENLSV
ncbi:MAG: response regulator [Dehalococcoidales bacterium]|nr:response regulator [Dehalococcoidales bacterium]